MSMRWSFSIFGLSFFCISSARFRSYLWKSSSLSFLIACCISFACLNWSVTSTMRSTHPGQTEVAWNVA